MNQLCSMPTVPSAGGCASGLRAFSLGLLAALVLVGTATAQAPRREMVSITGRIIDVTNGEPIPGVLVVIPGKGVRAETNELGEFSVSGIAVGLYRLQLSHPDYNPAVGDFTVMRAGGFQTAMQPVARVGDELITGIMGDLSDRNTGNALAGASVRVNGGQAGTLTDGRGRFLDNIFIERLWRSLKYEAVYLHELRDGLQAERIVGSWIDFYNEVRPHSSLGGRTPGETYRKGARAG